MTTADGAAFLAIYTRVCKLWDRPVKEDVAVEYFSALKDLSLTVVDEAARQVCKSSHFFPKPVQWLTEAYKLETPKPGFRPERWVHTADGHRTPTFVCPTCEDSGWVADCGCPPSGMSVIKAGCETHGPRTGQGQTPIRSMMPCLCRSTNPAWMQTHRTVRQIQEQR